MPLFAIIVDVIAYNDVVLFVVQFLFTDVFNVHRHAYEVFTPNPRHYAAYIPMELIDPHVLHTYKHQYLISTLLLKYHVFEKN